MADDSGLGIPGKGPLASMGIGVIGLLLIIGFIFFIAGWCSGPDSYSLDGSPTSLEQYCEQYPELCATQEAE